MSRAPQPGARLGGSGELLFPPPNPPPATGEEGWNCPAGTLITSHAPFLVALSPTERVAESPACMIRYLHTWLDRPKPLLTANACVKWSVAESCVQVCVGVDSAAKHTMSRSPALNDPRSTSCDEAPPA